MADFAQTNNNGGANVNNVNSSSVALFSTDGTMLRIGFKNEMLTLTITPKVTDDSGKARWPRELSHSAMLRPQACAGLYEGFVDNILPRIKNHEDYEGFGAIPLNRDCTNLAGFGFAGGHATFNIFNQVGTDRTCNDVHTFTFDTTPFIAKYNPNTGTYNVDEIQGQLFVVLWAIQMAAYHLSGVVGHSSKVVGSYNTNQIISYIRAIAAKLGATPSQYGNFNGYRGNPDAPNFGSEDSGSSGATTWSAGYQDGGSVGHIATPDIQQVASLETLMGNIGAPTPVQ